MSTPHASDRFIVLVIALLMAAIAVCVAPARTTGATVVTCKTSDLVVWLDTTGDAAAGIEGQVAAVHGSCAYRGSTSLIGFVGVVRALLVLQRPQSANNARNAARSGDGGAVGSRGSWAGA